MWVKDKKIWIHKQKKEEATYERDTILGRCKVDGGISRTEKVTYRCPQDVVPMRKQAGSCSRFGLSVGGSISNGRQS